MARRQLPDDTETGTLHLMAKILAYGSLMWDNALATFDGDAVYVDGFRRAFVGENTTRWGSPEHPCPQIGLLPGEGCEAVVFQLPRGKRRLVLHNLAQREGTRAQTVRFHNGNGRSVRAKSFLPTKRATNWPDLDRVVSALGDARGYVGTGSEYIRTIIHAMDVWKIDDPLVREVWERFDK